MPKGIYIRTKKYTFSEETKKKMSLSKIGRKRPPRSLEHRRRLSEANKGCKGSNWKGGITSQNIIIRQSMDYKLWRTAVFERDNYTCIWCGRNRYNEGDKRVILNADHIKPFSQYPELRFTVDNGRTLCVECHRKTDTFSVKLLFKNKGEKL